MNKKLIRDLAMTGGIYDCLTDPYDKLENGDHHSSVMVDLERFAELIVRECADICYDQSNAAGGVDTHFGYGYKDCGDDIKRNFGVEL